MSLACKCDVCGKIMSLDKVDKHVREVMLGTYGYEDNDYEVQHFFDVCDDCYEKILGQMKKSKKSKKSDAVYQTAEYHMETSEYHMDTV